MHPRRIAFVGIAIVTLLLLPGCHRLGLVKSSAKPKAAASTAASSTTLPSTTATNTASLSVAVQNGGGIKGRGAAMVSRLNRLGFRPGKATNAKLTTYHTTIIFFNPGHAGEAAQIQKSLGLGKAQPATAGVAFATDVLVMVGKDF